MAFVGVDSLNGLEAGAHLRIQDPHSRLLVYLLSELLAPDCCALSAPVAPPLDLSFPLPPLAEEARPGSGVYLGTINLHATCDPLLASHPGL